MKKQNFKVLHPAAAKLVKSGFFKGIKSYAELKAKISKLAIDYNTKVEGDAFEVFVEVYLKVIKNLKEVIPAPCFTDETKSKYRYPAKMPDAGADGLYLSHNGEWTAYQAKFRSNQKSLTWGELGTFFGVTEYTPMRHVITTCQEIVDCVDEMKAHDGRFFSTREEDFEKLTKEDFKLIADFLEGETVTKKPYKLRNYQRKAVTNIVKTLKNESRTYVSMACGTGKTLVAIKAAAKMDKKNVVIFVPSLALLKQIYDEVIEHDYNADTRYLAICSDEKIKEGEEGENVKITDLDFPATTDVDVLRKQMRGAKKTVVFCTYQSAQVLVSLHKKFDFGIFDEAHKTVGKEYKLSATALFDDNIKITKRLFLTATPKFHPRGGADYVAMDNEQVYGRRCFDYSFSQAKEEGWITPFKVIVSVITSEDVDRELLNQTERGVRVGSDDLKAVHVANQLAFKQAAEKHPIKHTFSFHNSCLAARRFVSDSYEGIKTHIEDIQSYHVNGDQSSGERKRILNDFAASKFAIVSNAKCLTEGVDVPAVDCVAFIQPKKSTVDIVQAIGRAMRPYKGKEYGYLFVPLYIEMEEGETFEEAAQRTDYSQILEVARAMADHDDGLRDMLRAIVASDRIPPSGDGNTAERLPFEFEGEAIDLDLIRDSVSTRVIETLTDSWDINYPKLRLFFEENGHSNYPEVTNWRRGNSCIKGMDKGVAVFVKSITAQNRYGNLSENKLKLLEEINFSFNRDQSRWLEKLAECVAYKKEFGFWPNEAIIHFDEFEDFSAVLNKNLVTWMRFALGKNKKNRAERKKLWKKNSLPTDWPKFKGFPTFASNPFSMLARFPSQRENINLLKIFYKENGHTNTPQKLKKTNKHPHGSFLNNLKKDLRDKKTVLTDRQEKELLEMGVDLGYKNPHSPKAAKLKVLKVRVEYQGSKTNGMARNDDYTTYRIALRKTLNSGERVTSVTYSCPKLAEKACEFLQTKINCGDKRSCKELRDLVYEEIPRIKQKRKSLARNRNKNGQFKKNSE